MRSHLDRATTPALRSIALKKYPKAALPRARLDLVDLARPKNVRLLERAKKTLGPTRFLTHLGFAQRGPASSIRRGHCEAALQRGGHDDARLLLAR